MSEQRPIVIGRVVHFRSRTGACVPAMVTQVSDTDPTHIGVCVFKPTGVHTYGLGAGGSRHDPQPRPASGTWHWPDHTWQ